jgi:uncharacterized protein YkwD
MREYRHTLAFCLVAIVSTALAAPALAARTGPTNTCNAATAAKVVADTNDYRASLGLPRLTQTPKLNEFALLHARDMATSDNMTHSSSAGLSFAQRARTSSYRFRTMRENVAVEGAPFPQGLGSDLVLMWRHSPPHDANMRATDVSQIAVAVAPGSHGCYASMELGKPL